MSAGGTRPRVVFLINSLTGGGAERIMARLITHSIAHSHHHEMHLVLLDKAPEAYSVPDWIAVHRLDTAGSMAASLGVALRCLRVLEPDICLSFLTRANLVNVICAQLLGYKALISERVSPSSHHRRGAGAKLARILTRYIYPKADVVICPSAGVAADLLDNFGVPPPKVTTIPNPTDREALHRAATQPAQFPTSRPYFVAMGRLVENKNFALLLQAFARSAPEYDLVLIGDGPLGNQLRLHAHRLELSHRVHFTGFLENPFPLILGARAFISSSDAEGFPNAPAEAMMLGIPVIATNCLSGPAELLGEEPTLEVSALYEARHGLLVPVGDVAALARALTMMSSDGFRNVQAVRAAEGAARYQMQPAINAYWQVMQAALPQRMSLERESRYRKAKPEDRDML